LNVRTFGASRDKYWRRSIQRRRYAKVPKRCLSDALKYRTCNRAAVVAAGVGLIDDDDDRRYRVSRWEESDK
jgi:hypothetical protein